ncbi:MAG: adenylate kinase [Patescibacteria group bacterium]|jgi:adenylate kinase
MRLIIFGPQGSGKGTQAESIARRHGWPYISTGDIFRYNLKNQTEIGKQVAAAINAGHLVPDNLTNQIVSDRIHQPDCAVGFVLDGYPRNKSQLEFIRGITKIDLAIAIDLTDQQAIDRLTGRLACKCGLSYHVNYCPPKVSGICDKCGDKLFRRDDDEPEAIKKRLEIYHQETEPLVKVYKELGIFYRVDGAKSIEEVYQQIDQIINQASKI